MVPIVLIMLASLVLISSFTSFTSAATVIVQGGRIYYDEAKLQDYAMEQYKDQFGNSEDAILLVEDEQMYSYAYLPMVGWHVDDRVSAVFDSRGALGSSMNSNIDEYYKYSLEGDLRSVISDMTAAVKQLGLSSSYPDTCYCERDSLRPMAIDRTDLDLNTEIIKKELETFKSETGIPMRIIIEDADDEEAFGRGFSSEDIGNIVISAIMITIAVVLIIIIAKNRKKIPSGQNGGGGDDGFEPPKL